MFKQNKAFTLVELIVVIIILAILWTIAFISLQWFSRDARDSVRLTDMKSIQKWAELFKLKSDFYPIPDDYLTVTASWVIIRYQWIAWSKLLWDISVHWWWQDPLTNEYYDYILDWTKIQIQISWYFENSTLVNNDLVNRGYAVEKWNFIKTIWASLWLISQNNEWLHKTNTWILDVRNTSEEYTVVFSESDSITSNSWQLLFTNIYNRDSWLLNNKELAKLDDSLILYFDMETTVLSWSTILLKDLSWKWNNWICMNGVTIENCWEWWPVFFDNYIQFDWLDDFIQVEKYFSYYGNLWSSFLIDWSITKIDDLDSWNEADTFLWNYCGQYSGWTYNWFWIKNYKWKFEYRDYSIWNINHINDHFVFDNRYFIASVLDRVNNRLKFFHWNWWDNFFSSWRDISSSITESTCNMRVWNNYWSMWTLDNLEWKIYSIRIYNRALSDNEIKNNYWSTFN